MHSRFFPLLPDLPLSLSENNRIYVELVYIFSSYAAFLYKLVVVDSVIKQKYLLFLYFPFPK